MVDTDTDMDMDTDTVMDTDTDTVMDTDMHIGMVIGTTAIGTFITVVGGAVAGTVME